MRGAWHPVVGVLLLAVAAPAAALVLPEATLRKTLSHHKLDGALVDRVLASATTAVRQWAPQASDFLRPPEAQAVVGAFAKLVDVSAEASGGYPLAERQRVVFRRGDDETDLEAHLPELLKAVEVEGNFLFDSASHRDFLGAVLSLGLKREAVGDVLVTGERGAQLVLAPPAAALVCAELSRVRSVPVTCREVPLAELKGGGEVRRKSVQTVEASLRLDAVASAGFGMSRSKMASHIESGSVLVDWVEARSASAKVAAGNVVTLRGTGRVTIDDVATTAKGRFRVAMTRLT